MNQALCLVLLFSTLFGTKAHSCGSAPSYGDPNLYPLNEGSQQSQLIATTKNGKLYNVVVPNDGGNTATNISVVHLWGSAYDMGYAQGTLKKNQLIAFMNQAWSYLETEIDQYISFLPKWLQDQIATLGLDAALDWTYYMSEPFTPPYFYEEMHGLADSTGVDYNTIVRVHMIAGLTEGACSMLGAWGKALDPSFTGKVLQLRALDWDMSGPFRDYPQVTVYHPNNDQGHPFANVGMTGFIGGLTGLSATQLGISEIGASYPDSSFGTESRIGLPFIFLLRDILQWDQTVDDATNRMVNTRRTCNLILGVGDGKLGYMHGYEYSYSVLDVFDDDNMRPDNDTWHPKMDSIVYWGMDWDCPSYNLVLSQQIAKYYGKLNAQVAMQYISSVQMSGDNHLAFYDLTNLQLYVSFAAPHAVGGKPEAYNRQYTHFDAKSLFNEPHP